MKDESFVVGYEYAQIKTNTENSPFYLDCYKNLGWKQDDTAQLAKQQFGLLFLKRDCKLLNRMELTRLQRNFEACVTDIACLECRGSYIATKWAVIVALVGTVCMAASVFAVTAQPPLNGCALSLQFLAFWGGSHHNLTDLVVYAACFAQFLWLFSAELCLGLRNAEQVSTKVFTVHRDAGKVQNTPCLLGNPKAMIRQR